MGEAKTVCPLCKRKPGTRHKKKCARGKRFYGISAYRQKPCPSASYPIADIYDCVAGPLKLKAIPKGTPTRVGKNGILR